MPELLCPASYLPIRPCVLQRPRREEVCQVLQNPRPVSLEEPMSEALAVEGLQLEPLLL